MLSVVIPLYNKEAYVLRAVRSVLDQTVNEFEIIVVDDGSTDLGPDRVRQCHDSRITLVRQKNSGVSAARNRGIELARGAVIAFLDADDEWEPWFLETVLGLTRTFPNAGLFATSYRIIGPNGRSRLPKLTGVPGDGWEGVLSDYFHCAAFGEPPVCSSAVAIRRDVLKAVGGFVVGKRMGEDLDMWGRVALNYAVAFSSRVGAIYHQDVGVSACATFHDGDEHPFVATVQQLKSQGETVGASVEDLDRYVAKLMLENARQYVLAGRYRCAMELAGHLGGPEFRWKWFLWATPFNKATHWIWKIWNSVRECRA